MQIVSDTVKALLARYAKITLAVYLDGQKLDTGIGSCELSTSCGDEEEFSFGNACASSVTFVLNASTQVIKGSDIKITWAVDETEHPLFTGKVEKPNVSAGRTTVEAWDAMYYGGSDAFVPSAMLIGDVDAATAFSAVAAYMGVEAEQDSLTLLAGITVAGGFANLSATENEVSNSAVAGYIAGLVGGNALISRSGLLCICKYGITGWETEPYSGGASAEYEDFNITGVTFQRAEIVTVKHADGTTSEEEQVIEFQSGDGTLMVSNPLADQYAADRALEALIGISIRPGAYSFPGGILLEPGDLITVNSMDGSYTVACVTLVMTFDGGVKTSVACGGALETGGAAGAINQALATLQADFARLRSLVAENANIVSAKISNLRAEDIVAGRIRSTDFATVTLDPIYPGQGIYPSSTLFPNNGEQIIRGFEIDFASGIIRGIFWSAAMETFAQRLDDLSARVQAIENSTY